MPHRKRSTARTTQPAAVVIGGGIAGLLAARELNAASVAVTVLEAAPVFGGCVGSHDVAGLVLDSGAESFATRSPIISELAGDLGLKDKIAEPDPAGAWVQLPEGASPLPKTGVLGIPAHPWDPQVRGTLGLWGALRASMDRWLPATVGTGAELCSVSDLVRARMGRAVLDRLVAPVVGGVHSADPGLLDVDMVAPGLRKLVLEQGSLAAAVTQLRAGAKAGSAVGGLAGGMHTLVTALTEQLRAAGVQLHPGTRVNAVERISAAPDAGSPPEWRITAGRDVWTADAVVIATEGGTAVDLISAELPAVESFKPGPGPEIKLVTLVLDLPELDVPSRGTGVLVAPHTPGIQAKALTHATAKWKWLADEAGPGTHVLRLSYGRAHSGVDHQGKKGSLNIAPEPDTDVELLDAAVSDAAALLGVHISAADLLGWDVVRWQGALPFAAVGHRERMARVRELTTALPGFAMVGAWLAGTGLVAVAADAMSAGRGLAESLTEVAAPETDAIAMAAPGGGPA